MPLWIQFTLLALVMQALRTAAQKQLAGHLSTEATTLTRYLFGLPFAVVYFLLLNRSIADLTSSFHINIDFLVSASFAGFAQIGATYCLVKSLTLNNFAVGTALAKTEALLTAVIGSLFFDEMLSTVGFMAIAIGVLGVLIAGNWRISVRDLRDNKTLLFGFGSGLGFALSSLFIRDASQALEGTRIAAAAGVLVYMVVLQTLVCLAWVAVGAPGQFVKMRENIRSCWFVGLSSLLGSIGWFTAMSLQNPAVVKTLGQGEFVVTLLITVFYFGEKITRREALGMLLILGGIIILLWSE